MADEEDTAMQDTPARTEEEEADEDSGSESGDEEEEEDEPQVEWLATGREKRSTAGNRLHSLLQQEDADDELELLFAEADDDAGFSDVEADSDVQMDDSDDDEDQGPAAGDDDMEGEKELQKQARAEKAKKRKMEGGMPKGFKKKKVKIDPTVVQTAPPPRPKKKSERASWLPTADEAPTRASARGTTKESKQQLHAQMVDREIKRLNQLRQMEKAAKAKEAAKKPVMTQEDRLKEAARVERSNAKSLSRWEEAEQQREEEQLAKLAALKNRVLEGPVITWWSGMGEWVGGKLRQVGKNLIIEEKEKPTKKRKAAEMEESEAGSVIAGPTQPEVKPEVGTSTEETSKPVAAPNAEPSTEKPCPTPTVNKEPSPTIPASKEATPVTSSTPEIRYPPAVSSPRYMASPAPPNSSVLAPPAGFPMSAPPWSSVLAPPAGLPLSAPPFPQNILHRQYAMALPAFDGSTPLPGFGSYPPPPVSVPTPPPVVEEPPPEDLPPAIEHAACNYFILENFDEVAIKDKNVQTQIIFGRKFLKAPSKCVLFG